MPNCDESMVLFSCSVIGAKSKTSDKVVESRTAATLSVKELS